LDGACRPRDDDDDDGINSYNKGGNKVNEDFFADSDSDSGRGRGGAISAKGSKDSLAMKGATGKSTNAQQKDDERDSRNGSNSNSDSESDSALAQRSKRPINKDASKSKRKSNSSSSGGGGEKGSRGEDDNDDEAEHEENVSKSSNRTDTRFAIEPESEARSLNEIVTKEGPKKPKPAQLAQLAIAADKKQESQVALDEDSDHTQQVPSPYSFLILPSYYTNTIITLY